MNDTVSVACEKCGARFRVKPNAYKIMKALKCTKCGTMIPLAKPAEEPAPPPPAPPPPPVSEPETVVAPPAAEPVAEAVPAKPAEEDSSAKLLLEIEQLRAKLKAAERENAESDARIASLQELWHSKELEVREMSARLAKAEAEAKQAREIRDAFLSKAKTELAHYLVGERDAALSRFADLEKKLLSIKPDAG